MLKELDDFADSAYGLVYSDLGVIVKLAAKLDRVLSDTVKLRYKA